MNYDIKLADGFWTVNGKKYSELNPDQLDFLNRFFRETKISAPMTPEVLMGLPEGTKIKVNLMPGEFPGLKQRYLTGTLTFQEIPEDFYAIENMEVYDMNASEQDLYNEYRDCFSFGISYLEPREGNLNNRRSHEPLIVKDLPSACYEYPAGRYELLD